MDTGESTSGRACWSFSTAPRTLKKGKRLSATVCAKMAESLSVARQMMASEFTLARIELTLSKRPSHEFSGLMRHPFIHTAGSAGWISSFNGSRSDSSQIIGVSHSITFSTIATISYQNRSATVAVTSVGATPNSASYQLSTGLTAIPISIRYWPGIWATPYCGTLAFR
jgi:hypothetical protein